MNQKELGVQKMIAIFSNPANQSKQTQGLLRDGNRYCAVGILAHELGYYVEDGISSDSTLTAFLEDELEVDEDFIELLIDWNDHHGYDFQDIAAILKDSNIDDLVDEYNEERLTEENEYDDDDD